MKKLIYLLGCLTVSILCITSCSVSGKAKASGNTDFVTVGDDGNLYIGDSIYRFVGANFWYGAILASEGRGGDRERLQRELDHMQSLGIDNLRILIGAEGDENLPAHIMPVLQTSPGVYNDTILDGLDYLMEELERRGMKAVLYLNNSWEWSGGYGTYLQWAGAGRALIPAIDGYNEYCDYVSQFVTNDSAKKMYDAHVRYIIGRTNRYTGQPYTESPALMSWQIANEPRAFSNDSIVKEAFYDWIISTAQTIHELDSNHLVSTGSEGFYGCQIDMDLWQRIHNHDAIDYAIIHIWPMNWGWVDRQNHVDSIGVACNLSEEYIDMHLAQCPKPLVIEEFGYPRDGAVYDYGSPVTSRDEYYSFIFDKFLNTPRIAGLNFWAWGGEAVPAHETWQPWDPYTGDPAQEPQGLYSVFNCDTLTLSHIRDAAHSNRK